MRSLSRYAHERVLGWRTGSRQSQLLALAILLICVTASLAVSLTRYDAMPATTYFVWLLLGMLLLRFPLLLVLVGYTMAGATGAVVLDPPVTEVRVSAVVSLALAALIILWVTSRQRSGLPGLLGESVLADLRDRLQAQAVVPPLPPGWSAESAMRAAHNVAYAGDFLVADLHRDGRRLEMILVDVCGKGVAAGPQALQFAGALGGLVGALPPEELMCAANTFLVRQKSEETFATAVHVMVDLVEGSYSIVSAGHPPALRWSHATGEWVVDNARGTALGVTRHPELEASAGRLERGDALMFYTDGVVESRTADVDTGIEWLRQVGREAVACGFEGAPRRIIRQVPRGGDDRAVLILSRRPEVDPSTGLDQ